MSIFRKFSLPKRQCFNKGEAMNRAVILVFSLYFMTGLFIVKDYGISLDERVERETSLSVYVYVMGKKMHASKNENIRNTAENAPDMTTWEHRFHGTALQNITMLIEHLFNFEMSSRNVFLLRHVFTFLNYFIAGIFFYLILRRRFGNTFIPLLGVLLYILYPRFFGESFYNIKDIIFFSWYIISIYFALRWLEDEKNSFILPAAVTLAIATNTRILGISVLLLVCVFSAVLGMRRKLNFGQIIQKPLMLIGLTFVCYVIITPLAWENPLKSTIDTFFHFMQYQLWNRTHFYMGEMITREVPWHYIPVWMGITIPLLYIAMFFVGTIRRPAHLFDVFFIALFFCTLFGFIGLRIDMYGGWRHAYCIYGSFLYIAVLGIERSFAFVCNKGIAIKRGFACIIAACLVYLFAWTIINHPYQHAYFNLIGRQFAEKNFILDTWEISHIDLIRYALANDNRPKITFAVNTGENTKHLILTDTEKNRIVFVNRQKVDYYIQNTDMPYKDREYHPGFVELTAITVDGMKISRLLKYVETSGEFFDDAWDKIKKFESNVDDDYDAMYDGSYNSGWSTNRPQQPGDYMMFEFDEDVNYNYLFLGLSREQFGEYPRDLSIYVSDDGDSWQKVPVAVVANVYYKFETSPYRFLKLENNGSDEHYSWSVGEMEFGYDSME
jgi:hypothetical protein